MGRTAVSKLRDADFLGKEAQKIAKSDPESAEALRTLARLKRRQAIKQFKTKPKRKV